MNRLAARGYLLSGLLLAGGAAVWATVHLARPAGAGSTIESANPGSSDEKPTLEFFRNPATVADVSMRALDGRTFSPADWRGKVVLVNFWATWCGPCREEIPDLVALQSKYGQYLQVVGVSQDEAPPDVVQRFAEQQRVNYPIVMSTPELEKAFPGIYALPTSFLIDRTGRIVQKHVGALTPLQTELETRALAGLPVNASVQEVDAFKRAALGDGAQATKIPGIDLSAIPASRRSDALKKLNGDACSCGCDLSVAKCRIDDPKCGTSLPLAQEIVNGFLARKPSS